MFRAQRSDISRLRDCGLLVFLRFDVSLLCVVLYFFDFDILRFVDFEIPKLRGTRSR